MGSLYVSVFVRFKSPLGFVVTSCLRIVAAEEPVVKRIGLATMWAALCNGSRNLSDTFILQHVIDHPADKGNIRARTQLGINVCHLGCPRIARVNGNKRGSFVQRF